MCDLYLISRNIYFLLGKIMSIKETDLLWKSLFREICQLWENIKWQNEHNSNNNYPYLISTKIFSSWYDHVNQSNRLVMKIPLIWTMPVLGKYQNGKMSITSIEKTLPHITMHCIDKTVMQNWIRKASERCKTF